MIKLWRPMFHLVMPMTGSVGHKPAKKPRQKLESKLAKLKETISQESKIKKLG